jgi:hypothetical protein
MLYVSIGAYFEFMLGLPMQTFIMVVGTVVFILILLIWWGFHFRGGI